MAALMCCLFLSSRPMVVLCLCFGHEPPTAPPPLPPALTGVHISQDSTSPLLNTLSVENDRYHNLKRRIHMYILLRVQRARR